MYFYNKNVLKEAGIDESQLPKTRSEFIDVCRKISDAGNGKYFGIIDSGAQAKPSGAGASLPGQPGWRQSAATFPR